MKTLLPVLFSCFLLPSAWLAAEDASPPVPPPVTRMEMPAATPPPAADDQKLYAPPGALIAPEQARAIIDRFKDAYGKLGSPRLLIYVNRSLVDVSGGLKLTHRSEHTEVTRTVTASDADPAASTAGTAPFSTAAKPAGETKSEHVTAENTYKANDSAQPTLADRQTVRDVERLFGRPLRVAGAKLADQPTAAALIADKPMAQLSAAGDDARKDREALQGIADVAIEVLISSRPLTVAEVSGDRTYNVPDIQATAIRLKDAAILGQASATDVIGKRGRAARVVRTFDVNDIAEATALALMEDMAMSAK